ncbi:MAG: ParB/RepB/Spo0J family partition protein [Myxococcota bacterium]
MSRKRAPLTLEKAQETLSHMHLISRYQDKGEPMKIEEIDVDRLIPNPFQPRHHFSEAALEELAISIRNHGFFGHLLVRPKGRCFELAFGERRLRAASLANMERVPVQIRDLSDQEMMELALTENLQREDLSPLEEARAFATIRDQFDSSVRDIGKRIGKSKSYVASLLSLLRYPDIEQAMESYNLPVRTAEELARIEDLSLRQELTQQVIEGRLDRQGVVEARSQALAQKNTPTLSLFPKNTSHKETSKTSDTSPRKASESSDNKTFTTSEKSDARTSPVQSQATTLDSPTSTSSSKPSGEEPLVLTTLRYCIALMKQEDPFAGLSRPERVRVKELLGQLSTWLLQLEAEDE